MAAAIAAARTLPRGSVLLLERNPALGEKIRITGGGRCNLTHAGSAAELLERGFLQVAERRFLRPALHAFDSDALLRLLAPEGVRCTARPDGKLFPDSGSATSVVQAFERLLGASGVKVERSGRVLSAKRHEGGFLVETQKASHACRMLIVATGGVSWPATGSTGDGIALAASFGHRVVASAAALAPLYTEPLPAVGMAGVALRDVQLVAAGSGEKAVRRGDLLFTHKGLSGPAALSLSRDAASMRARGVRVELSIDLLPELRHDELERLLLEHAARQGGQLLRKFLQACPMGGSSSLRPPEGWPTIPTALVPALLHAAGIEGDATWATLGKRGRKGLVEALKSFKAGRVRAIPLKLGEVSSGGVALAEVDPKSLQSRLVPGLYLSGELLDYAGEIGGFNLQAAFSTGWVAGSHAAARLGS